MDKNVLEILLKPEVLQTLGTVGLALVLLLLGFMSAFLLLIRKSFKASENNMNAIKEANQENQEALIQANRENSNNMKKFFDGFIDMVNVQNASTTKLLEEIRKAVGKTFIEKSLLKQFFEQVSMNHVNIKGAYVEKILIKNNIKERSEQIKKNIESKFMEITQKEIHLFSQLTTEFGDFGKLFSNWVDTVWEDFMQSVFCIVFSDDEIDQKLNDLKNLMEGALSNFWDDIINK